MRSLILVLVGCGCVGEVQTLPADVNVTSEADAGVEAGSDADAGPLELVWPLPDDAGMSGVVRVSASVTGGVDPIAWVLIADGKSVASGMGRHISAPWDSAAAHEN